MVRDFAEGGRGWRIMSLIVQYTLACADHTVPVVDCSENPSVSGLPEAWSGADRRLSKMVKYLEH